MENIGNEYRACGHNGEINTLPLYYLILLVTFTFTFMHLADAFIQSDLQCIHAIHFLSVCVFPGN